MDNATVEDRIGAEAGLDVETERGDEVAASREGTTPLDGFAAGVDGGAGDGLPAGEPLPATEAVGDGPLVAIPITTDGGAVVDGGGTAEAKGTSWPMANGIVNISRLAQRQPTRLSPS